MDRHVARRPGDALRRGFDSRWQQLLSGSLLSESLLSGSLLSESLLSESLLSASRAASRQRNFKLKDPLRVH
jgi:hypothetical protein